MAFSCSFMLKRLRETEDETDSQDKQSSNLIKSCVDNYCENDVSFEAVDTLNSILEKVCNLNLENPLHSAENAGVIQDNNLNDYVIKNDAKLSDDCAIINENKLNNSTVEQDIISTIDDDCISDCQIIDENQSSDDYLLNFNSIPMQITGAWSEFSSKTENNYTRGCKWAPDGCCILTCSADNVLRIFNLPVELWEFSKWQDISEMTSVLKFPEGELVYDFCWYPLMSSSDPNTCCFTSCSKNSTVHLWDAFTGDLRCSYRAFDEMDELTSARSLSFDSDGGKIFCGFDKKIRVYNTDLPGRTCEERPTFAKKSGQSGIISCFAFSSANRNISVAGSYKRTIGIYSEPSGTLECLLEGQIGGVTHLQFSPDGNLLYSGGRKDNEILCWDLRNLGEVLFRMKRSCPTNQRMYFDISRDGQYLVSGNNNGVISVWDTLREPTSGIMNDFAVLEPAKFFLAHSDCVNGISINPVFPLLCSSSGQRKFAPLLPDDDDDMFAAKPEKSDNSLRLWWIGRSS